MTEYRRNELINISPNTAFHPGLWLDKFLKSDFKGSTNEKSSNEVLVSDAAASKVQGSYRRFYDRWKDALAQRCGVENCREAYTLGRMAINLGAEAVLETSIALHRTYGVPYIPGSALKGLAAHYVMDYLKGEARWEKNKGDGYITLFGTTAEAGFINFYDAMYIPGSATDDKPLCKDVVTVHHPDYYQGKKPDYLNGQDAPPADWDSPTPIPFLTASGCFLIALEGPRDWVGAAFEILELALCRSGIGAKTNSGYGRLAFKGSPKFPCAATSVQIEHNPQADADKVQKIKQLLNETPPPGRSRGTVMKVNPDQRYGQVNPAKGGGAVFIHINHVSGHTALRNGMIVEYTVGKNDKGNSQAEKVKVLLTS